jgi:hypothetical protein
MVLANQRPKARGRAASPPMPIATAVGASTTRARRGSSRAASPPVPAGTLETQATSNVPSKPASPIKLEKMVPLDPVVRSLVVPHTMPVLDELQGIVGCSIRWAYIRFNRHIFTSPIFSNGVCLLLMVFSLVCSVVSEVLAVPHVKWRPIFFVRLPVFALLVFLANRFGKRAPNTQPFISSYLDHWHLILWLCIAVLLRWFVGVGKGGEEGIFVSLPTVSYLILSLLSPLFIAIAGELQQICSDEGADTTGDLCKIQIQYHKPLTNKQSCLQASGSGSPPCGKT